MTLLGWGKLRAVVLVVGLASAAAAGQAGPARAADLVGASESMSRTWGVNGHVAAIAPAGPVAVVGGDFDKVLSPSGDERVVSSVAKLRPATGTFDDWPVTVDGPVSAVAVDGDTVYLGGDFRHVDGALRVSLAAVSLADGSLLPWAPTANIAVEALAVSGGDVYIGGRFSSVTDGQGTAAVSYLARISSAGVLDRDWSTAVTLTDRVRSLLPKADGTGIYVGGDFGAIGAAGYAARLTLLSTGATPTIDPVFRSGTTNGSGHAPVFALALDGTSLLVAAGGSGGGCTLQDASTGVTRWSYHTTGNVVAAAFLGPMAYCGGHFSGSGSFAAYSRDKVAEVVTATGEITSFAPSVNSALGIFALAGSPTALLAGGDFTKVGRVPQPHVGMFVDVSAVRAPGQPGHLGARSGDRQVILSWDAPDTDGGAPVRTYKIYRARGSGAFGLLAKTKALSYLDAAVVNGTPGDPASTYRYFVLAVNPAGAGAASDTVGALPLAGQLITPSAPQDLAAVGELGVSSLSWTAPLSDGGSPITSYVVLRGTSSQMLAPLATLAPTATAYSDTAVVVGTRYYYAVVAVNAVGPGVPSKEASAMPNTGVPGAPTLAGSVVGTGVHLLWQPSSNSGASPVTKYILTRDAVRILVADAATFDHTDLAVASGHTYTYRVKAVNAYGASAWSDLVVVTLP